MLHVLHDHVNLVHCLPYHDPLHLNDIGVVEAQENIEFSDGGDGEALLFCDLGKLNLLDGYNLTGQEITSPEDLTIYALMNLI